MSSYTCRCLNICIKSTKDTSRLDEGITLPSNEFFADLTKIEVLNLYASKIHAANDFLVKVIKSDNWLLYHCLNCSSVLYAQNSESMHDLVVDSTSNISEEKIVDMKQSSLYSKAFKIIIFVKDSPEFGNNDCDTNNVLESKFLEENCEHFLNREKLDLLKRIKNYEIEQQNDFNELEQKTLMETKILLIKLLQNYRTLKVLDASSSSNFHKLEDELNDSVFDNVIDVKAKGSDSNTDDLEVENKEVDIEITSQPIASKSISISDNIIKALNSDESPISSPLTFNLNSQNLSDAEASKEEAVMMSNKNTELKIRDLETGSMKKNIGEVLIENNFNVDNDDKLNNEGRDVFENHNGLIIYEEDDQEAFVKKNFSDDETLDNESNKEENEDLVDNNEDPEDENNIDFKSHIEIAKNSLESNSEHENEEDIFNVNSQLPTLKNSFSRQVSSKSNKSNSIQIFSTSVPIKVPGVHNKLMTSRNLLDSDNNYSHLNPDEMAAQFRELARSVCNNDGSEIFGELPTRSRVQPRVLVSRTSFGEDDNI